MAKFYSSWDSLSSDSRVLQAVNGYKIEFNREAFQIRKPREIKVSVEEVCKLEALCANDGDYNSMICLSETSRSSSTMVYFKLSSTYWD